MELPTMPRPSAISTLVAPLLLALASLGATLTPRPAIAQGTRAGISTDDIANGIAIGRILVSVLHRSGASHASTRRPSGSASTGSASTGSASTARVSAGAARTARRVLDSGESFIGTPYVWGGSTPAGFDCSGFVQYVFREHGVELPRTSRQMAHAGVRLPARVASLAPGDLMLFSGSSSTISHVAIYAGNGRILHSSSSGHGVGYDRLDGSRRGRYFTSHFVAARRVIENGASLVQPLTLLERETPFDHFDPPDHAPARP
jgi:cell wall-associated NlpC family hydrolase